MATAAKTTTRGLVERLTPLLAQRPPGERLFVVAMLERGSADRYREWAVRAKDPERARGLQECARREEEIATRLYARYGDAITQPADLAALLGVVQKEVIDLFGGRSDEEQYAIQASAERGGEAFWEGLAAEERDAATRQTLVDCAELEAQSAAFLESLAR